MNPQNSSLVIAPGGNAVDLINAHNRDILGYAQLAKQVTRGQLVDYANKKFPGQTTVRGRAEDSTAVAHLLQGYTLTQLTVFALTTSVAATKVEVTTFNAGQYLIGQGYSLESVASVDETTDLGVTLKKGSDGKPFPMKSPSYVKATSMKDHFYLPVDRTMNTNYFSKPNVTKMTYVQVLADASMLLSGFLEMRNGKISTIHGEQAGQNLLQWEQVLQKSVNTDMLGIGLMLEDHIKLTHSPHPKGWSATTLAGIDFAHQLYLALANQIVASTDMWNIILHCVNHILRPGKNGQAMRLQEGEVVLETPSLYLPDVINDKVIDWDMCDADLDQAYQSLSLGRTFRGENSGTRGSLSRHVYLPFQLPSEMAEICYMATNYAPFIRSAECLLVIGPESKAVNSVLHLLHALIVLGWSGTVVVPRMTGVVNVLIPSIRTGYNDNFFRFSNGKFFVLVSNNPYDYFSPNSRVNTAEGMFKLPKKTVVVDKRIVHQVQYNVGRFHLTDGNIRDALKDRLAEVSPWNYPVVFRCNATNFAPAIGDIYNVKGKDRRLHFVSNIEIHNLVGVVGLGFGDIKIEPWRYDLLNYDQHKPYASSVIIANIMKTMHMVYRAGPREALQYKKLKVPMPIVRGLGRLGLTSLSFTSTSFQAAIVNDPLKIFSMYAEVPTEMKAQLLNITSVRESLSDEGTSSYVVAPTVIASNPKVLDFSGMSVVVEDSGSGSDDEDEEKGKENDD